MEVHEAGDLGTSEDLIRDWNQPVNELPFTYAGTISRVEARGLLPLSTSTYAVYAYLEEAGALLQRTTLKRYYYDVLDR